MKEYQVKLDSIEKVKEFVSITSKYSFETDLCYDRYVIDAKSIMGVLSLDISKTLVVKAYCDNCADFEEKIKSFIINKL